MTSTHVAPARQYYVFTPWNVYLDSKGEFPKFAAVDKVKHPVFKSRYDFAKIDVTNWGQDFAESMYEKMKERSAMTTRTWA